MYGEQCRLYCNETDLDVDLQWYNDEQWDSADVSCCNGEQLKGQPDCDYKVWDDEWDIWQHYAEHID